ncbi:hypothetical protein [Acinetobacter baumannii]|uniref:hypothetical protein n=1 Tax=Acinetobacter baumannii TaxID=470 RepID=UPI00233F4842|nr:hypothetical protein [Acinetobacter baumannii]MDC4475085.1 hypothetical protein [Acinetobacter baumannii]MDC4633766.1 hypothetical protein [Acinetobacter baumannii]HEO1772954.1 hypothetical protein [Acinetobacter baumannii]HEO1792674.1 hypothetical protein [Acinetobacter baumannii]
MSPPELLPEDNYQKPLQPLPLEFDIEKPIETRFFYNQVSGYIFKFTEFKGNPGCDYSGCIEIYYCHYNEMALSAIDAVTEDYSDPFEAAAMVFAVGLDYEYEKLIGRYTYKDFTFKDKEETKFGKQIRGAYVEPEYQQYKLATFIYKFLAKKYSHLISDNHQTHQGHKLWVLSVLKWGKVRAYDCLEQKFIGSFDPIDPSEDFKPWSIPFNFPAENEKFLIMEFCVRTDVPLANVVLIAHGSECE